LAILKAIYNKGGIFSFYKRANNFC